MSPKEFARSRRRFLQQASASLGYLATTVGGGGLAARRAMAAGSANRRHLINIQGFGGWDSQWFYNCIRPSEAQFFDPSNVPAAVSNRTLHHVDKDTNGNITRKYDDLYTTRFDNVPNVGSPFLLHPFQSSLGPVYFGLGGKVVYGKNPAILGDIAFWRGMSYSNGHAIGNKVITHGNLSQYALSFSSLISAALAKDYPRPLHFVQISNSPNDLLTNWAMATGYAVPVNIGDYTAFKNLTKTSPDEFGDGRRTAINAAVDALSKMVGGFQLKSSKTIFQGFQTGFEASTIVCGSNLAENPEFLWIWKSYVLELMSMIDTVQPPGGGGSDFIGTNKLVAHYDDDGRNWLRFESITAQASISAAQMTEIDPAKWPSGRLVRRLPDLSAATTDAQRAAIGVQVSDFLAVYNLAASGYYRSIVDVAFSYAMAFFLVKNDLSAVVDIATPCGDYHDLNDEQAMSLMITHTCFRKLVEDLKGTGYGGGSLLDITTVVMSSEFDRMPNLSINVAVDRRGTGHGYSTSVILAGMGVRGGRVYGGIKRGPGSTEMGALSANTGLPATDLFPRVGDPSLLPQGSPAGSSDPMGLGFSFPLPVNSDGQPDPAGEIVTTKSIFPTVMKIFNVDVPANQITDAYALDFVRKT